MMKGRIFLLMQLLHLAVSFRAYCPQPCIMLNKCPELAASIQANVRAVQEATCSFQGRIPLVCCPESTPATPTPTPSPETPVSNLLPQSCGHFPGPSAIVGGTETRLGDFPWVAALGYKAALTNRIEFLCGGSVINERYVLTAAHCVTSKQPEVIRLGEWDLTTELDCETVHKSIKFCAEPAQDFLYEEILSHPDYDTRADLSDDIALIRLTTPIDFERNYFPRIHPICLPERDFDVHAAADQRQAVATGWGFSKYTAASNILLRVNLELIESERCNDTYSGRLVDEQLCFGGAQDDKLCWGDSGSPLVVSVINSPPHTQIGILSYSPVHCSGNGIPAVYTSVAKYRDWIEQNLRQ